MTSLVSTGNDKNASPLHVFLTVNSLQLISLPCFVGESSQGHKINTYISSLHVEVITAFKVFTWQMEEKVVVFVLF